MLLNIYTKCRDIKCIHWDFMNEVFIFSTFKHSGNGSVDCENLTLKNSDPCWESSSLDRADVYRIMVVSTFYTNLQIYYG